MWVFYNNIATTSQISAEAVMFVEFIATVLIAGLIIMAPTYFEKKKK
jgi:uncharacterized membrane protein